MKTMSSPVMESKSTMDSCQTMPPEMMMATGETMEMNSAMPMKPMMMAAMRRRKVLVAGALVLAAIVWYAFRPELLFIDNTVDEAFPVTAGEMMGVTMAEGMFHSVAHDTMGMASIIELDNQKRILRLDGFETSNGPDVHVLLGKATDANDDATVKNTGYYDLGSLKGNIGDQNYDIPTDVDLADYNSVTIWCNRFNVNFGTAPLKMH
jgi:hypothetical protein